jgi:hypothetical protein
VEGRESERYEKIRGKIYAIDKSRDLLSIDRWPVLHPLESTSTVEGRESERYEKIRGKIYAIDKSRDLLSIDRCPVLHPFKSTRTASSY